MGSEAYRRDRWQVTPEVEAPLRAALADNVNNYAGQGIAHFLVRAGCRRMDTLAALHPWHAIFFKWRQAGYTAQHVIEMVLDSTVVASVPAEASSRISAWLDDTLAPDGIASSLPISLFGMERVAFAFLRDIGFEPRHDELFAALAKAAMPSLAIHHASQHVDRNERFVDVTSTTRVMARDDSAISVEDVPVLSDRGAHWVVQYELEGKEHAFFAECRGTWMDSTSVLANFDRLMLTLDRPDRVFEFEYGPGESDEHGFYIVADPTAFLPLATQLFIPLKLREPMAAE
jgi:hypothetical protein